MKKRKRKKKNNYFTQVHEDAIIEYCASTDGKHRNVLYKDVIRPVFGEMINKIVFTYKFTNLPNIDSLKDECEMHLVTILSNFDPNKGSKAFSYFSVITKNWFIAKVKKTALQLKREAGYDQWVSFDVVWEETLKKAQNQALHIPDVVRSGKIDSINAEFTKARKEFAKACNNYLNSKEHKAMIEAFKKVGAIS